MKPLGKGIDADITIPAHGWKCRDYQQNLWNYLEGGGKRAVVLWHRRSGKDLFSINRIVWETTRRQGTYWHVFPYQKQAKQTIWEGYTKDGIRFMDYFPRGLIESVNSTDMRINLKNGSTYQLIGADSPDRLVGAGPIGIIFSEASLMTKYAFDLVRPMLNENDGWALFVTTPRGRNWIYELWDNKDNLPSWFFEKLTIDQTYQVKNGKRIPIVTKEMLLEERLTGMSESLIQQEYYCSFDASDENATYGDVIKKAYDDGRIRDVPYEPNLPVHTAWDIGIADFTAIIFFQRHLDEIRIIDCYEANNRSLDHYAGHLRSKNYVYGDHFGPQDLKVRELSTGQERLKIMRRLGLDFKIVNKHLQEDGVEWSRSLFNRMYFDKNRTSKLLEALKRFVLNPDARAKSQDFDHLSDAFRYMCMSMRPDDKFIHENRGVVFKAKNSSKYSNFTTLHNQIKGHNKKHDIRIRNRIGA